MTNEELEYQSTFNKVMFGVEVVTTVLDGFPWGGQLASSAFGWVGKIGRTTVNTLRSLGQNVAGLIMHRGLAGRVLFEVATATTTVAGAARSTGIGVKPLQMILRPARNTVKPDLTAYQRAFQQESARLVVKGGIPAGSSLADGTGIYRAPGGSPATLLVNGASETGELKVFRIQKSFNLYDPNGLVAPVLTPSGGVTPFKLRKMPNQLWSLDTLNRMPGGMPPKVEGKYITALREWQAHVSANALSPDPLDPATFFGNREIPLKTWNKHVTQTGSINTAGQLRLNPGGHAQFTDELFMTWLRMGDETKEAAEVFVRTHHLHPEHWASYISKGKLNAKGQSRLLRLSTRPAGRRSTIADQHLLDWDRLHLRPETPRTTPIVKQDVVNYALANDIHVDSWLKYVSTKGSFLRNNPSISARLERLGIPRTPPQDIPLDLTTPRT
ncbi:hypothetical protein AZH11_02345 [Pseudomonas simiae]|nr:hypothetical protein AZH11_02345 [Pseudomonas simiae]